MTPKRFSAAATAFVALIITLAATFALAACHGAEAKGSYPAANTNDCLPSVTLVDQHGHSISLASLKGQPILVDFIYTSCASTCPMLTAKMAAIARTLGPALGTKVKIVSITLDPERDHPAELLKYAEREGANDRGWLFLTGTPAQIANVLARFNIKRERGEDGSITHTISAFLLGPDGHQVRQYNALEVSPSAVADDIDRSLARS
ncbi:MAG TPA: SCO family protein [Candidatus Binataceae bacterium]